MPYKARPETLAQLTESDRAALKSLYFHRCLDESLMQRFFYHQEDDGHNEYTLKRIQWFVQEGLIDIDEYGEEKCAFYLTNLGLQTVRELFDSPLYVIDKKTGYKKYDVTSATLRTASKLLDHQMHLNELSLDIETRCNLAIDCYKDSKFANNFTYAQPDGVFELPQYDIFLEMDMAHENLSELKRKWEHYRNYRSAREYYLKRNKKIIVLFATENIKRGFAYRRGKVIKSVATSIFDLLGDDFDVFIGPSSEMAEVAERIIKKDDSEFQEVGALLQHQFGFNFSVPASIQELTGESYLYMRQLDERRNTMVRDGCPQSFFLADYLSRPLSVLKKAAFYQHTLSLMKPKLRRNIPLLLLVPDEQMIYQDLQAAEALGLRNVMFTTPSRLKTRLFPDALFQFDQLGNRYHFTDYSYSETIHEKKGV